VYHYEIKDGEYYLVYDGSSEPDYYIGPEISIAFTFEAAEKIGILHKHGRPDMVNQWANVYRKKLSDVNNKWANEMTVVTGKIPLEELSKMIEISGYIGRWYKQKLKDEEKI